MKSGLDDKSQRVCDIGSAARDDKMAFAVAISQKHKPLIPSQLATNFINAHKHKIPLSVG
jgi:hypothetical protein